MLFLRRAAGTSITLIRDRKIAATITFSRVDIATGEIDIKIGIEDPMIEFKFCTLRQGAEINLLEGTVRLKFSYILEYEDYPDAASVGIEAPRSITIHRSERLTGLGPEQIAALKGG